MQRIRVAGIVVLSAVLCTACASRQQEPSRISSTQGSMLVRRAQVTDVRDVTIHGRRSTGIGPVVGAVLGGLAGGAIGRGNGSTVAGIGGAIAGGTAGQRAEQAGSDTRATQLTVRFDDGGMRTYQIVAGESFRPGDMVTVSTSVGGIRIMH